MRILVTGGAGYIGSITTRALLDAGHECVVLDTLERGHARGGRPAGASCGGLGGGQGGPCRCTARMRRGHAPRGLHRGRRVGRRSRERYFRNNAIEPLVMLDEMVRHGVDSLVFSSTAAVYGEPESVPILEDARTLPVNPYGASKLAFEESLDGCRTNHGVRSVRFRYFNVGGAWPDASMGEAHEPETHIIPRVLGALRSGQERFEVYGGDYPTPDGTCVRDYIHVLDLAEAHRIGLEALVAGHGGGVYNLGNGQGYSNLEVVANVRRGQRPRGRDRDRSATTQVTRPSW